MRVEYHDGHYEEAVVLRPLGLEAEVTQDTPAPILAELPHNALGSSPYGPVLTAVRVAMSMEAGREEDTGHLIRITDSRYAAAPEEPAG
jgi:hypothetical protein